MKNLKIGTRLALGFGLVLVSMAQATHAMMQQPLAKERMISDWYRLIHTSVRRTTAISKSTDASLGPFFAEDAASSSQEVKELQQKVAALADTPQEQAVLDSMEPTRKAYISSRDEIVKLKKDGQLDAADQVLQQKFIPAGNAYVSELKQLQDLQRASIDQRAEEIDGIYATSRNALVSVGVLVFALGALAAWWLTVGITRPLGHAVRIARTVADSDLSSDIEVLSSDETGQLLQALKDMNDSLAGVVGRVRSGTDLIATASNEIASGNMDLSSRTEQQASSLEETASSMEELTATVRQNADNARQANQLAGAASSVAQRGGAVVAQVVDTMDAINASARKIVDIIAVIDGIAFQTNILALNAAVEAARGGGQGNQGADRRLGRPGRRRQQAGRAGRFDHDGSGRQRAARDRHHGRHQQRQRRAERRHRASQPRRRRDGPGDAAERRAGRGGRRRRRLVAGPGRRAGRRGAHLQAGQGTAGRAGANRVEGGCQRRPHPHRRRQAPAGRTPAGRRRAMGNVLNRVL